MGSKKLLGLIHWVKSFNKRAGNIFSPIDSYCWWKKILHRTSWHGESLSFVRLSTKKLKYCGFQLCVFSLHFQPNYQPPQTFTPHFLSTFPPNQPQPNQPQPKQLHGSHMVDFSSMLKSYTPNQPTTSTNHPPNQPTISTFPSTKKNPASRPAVYSTTCPFSLKRKEHASGGLSKA